MHRMYSFSEFLNIVNLHLDARNIAFATEEDLKVVKKWHAQQPARKGAHMEAITEIIELRNSC